LPENAYHAVLVTIPANHWGVLGVNYSFFGFKDYNDQKFALAYSRKLMERLSVGVQMDLISTIIPGYGNESRLSAEIGLLAEPVDHFFIGAHVFNPFQSNFTYIAERDIPTIMRVGMGYRNENMLTINAEVEKDLELEPVYKVGVEFNVLYGLNVRAGVCSNPASYSFGLGYIYKRAIAGLGFLSHEVMGFTPHFSLSYEFE
jgi:hypothetical protein